MGHLKHNLVGILSDFHRNILLMKVQSVSLANLKMAEEMVMLGQFSSYLGQDREKGLAVTEHSLSIPHDSEVSQSG